MKHADSPDADPDQLNDNPEKLDEPNGSTVLKFDLPGMLSAGSDVGLNGEFIWPINPIGLAQLYKSSPEHGRAIQVKAVSTFGGGLLGDGAKKLESLCELGATDLFVNLQLDVETYGNAFLQKIMSSDNTRLIGLRRLPAITMSRFRGGFLQRSINSNGEAKLVTFSKSEIVHLRDLCPMGRTYAFPSWIGAEGMLELAHAAVRYNAAFFKNNAMPEYAVIFKGVTPTKDQKQAVGDFFRNEHQGIDASHRTLVLHHSDEGSVTFEKLTADMKDGDFLKLIDAARDRMPVAHGTPPRIMGIMSAGGLGGGGELNGQLFIFENLTCKPKRRLMLDQLRPMLKLLELRPGIDDKNLGSDEIAFRPLDLTPPKDDAESLPDLVNAGILSVDEARVVLPFISDVQGTAGTPVKRSEPITEIERLTALLGKL